MALKYYDDVICAKIQKWFPDSNTRKLRVLKPDETRRLFETLANDTKDKNVELPLIAMSRNNDIELLMNVKNDRSYNGIKLKQTQDETMLLNVLPVKVEYQLDIYTKTYEESDDYLRELLFLLINNPSIKIEIPYNGAEIEHIANLRVLSTISDTSNISERLFSGQFTRWSIQIELQDAFYFNVPYKKNWKLYTNIDDTLPITESGKLTIHSGPTLDTTVEAVEQIPFNFRYKRT